MTSAATNDRMKRLRRRLPMVQVLTLAAELVEA
jgi:hypothetical protein